MYVGLMKQGNKSFVCDGDKLKSVIKFLSSNINIMILFHGFSVADNADYCSDYSRRHADINVQYGSVI